MAVIRIYNWIWNFGEEKGHSGGSPGLWAKRRICITGVRVVGNRAPTLYYNTAYSRTYGRLVLDCNASRTYRVPIPRSQRHARMVLVSTAWQINQAFGDASPRLMFAPQPHSPHKTKALTTVPRSCITSSPDTFHINRLLHRTLAAFVPSWTKH